MQTGGDPGTQNHGSQPSGDDGRTAGLPFEKGKPGEIPGRRATGPSLVLPGRIAGLPNALDAWHPGGWEVLTMKWIPLIVIALLPSVLLAGVTITSEPASVEVYLIAAWRAMDDGDYVAAWALYEYAQERDPHSPEAMAGCAAAQYASTRSFSTVTHTVASY